MAFFTVALKINPTAQSEKCPTKPPVTESKPRLRWEVLLSLEGPMGGS